MTEGVRLTKAQRDVLEIAAQHATIVPNFRRWNMVERMVTRGLLEARHPSPGMVGYAITPAGRAALLKGEDDAG